MYNMYRQRKRILITDKVNEFKHIIFTHEKELDVIASSEDITNRQIVSALDILTPQGSLRNKGSWVPEIIVGQIYQDHFGFSLRWILPNSIKDNSGRIGLIYCHSIVVYSKGRSNTLIEKLSEAGAYLLYLYTHSLSGDPLNGILWDDRVELVRSSFLKTIHENDDGKNDNLDFLIEEFSNAFKIVSSKNIQTSLNTTNVELFSTIAVSPTGKNSVIQIPLNYSTPVYHFLPQLYCSDIFNKGNLPCVYMPNFQGNYLTIEIVESNHKEPRVLNKKNVNDNEIKEIKDSNMHEIYESKKRTKFFGLISTFSLIISSFTLLIVLFFIFTKNGKSEISNPAVKNLVKLEVKRMIDDIDIKGLVKEEVMLQLSKLDKKETDPVQFSNSTKTSIELIDLVLKNIGSSGTKLNINELDKAAGEDVLHLFSEVDQERIKKLKDNFYYYDRNADSKLSSKELSVLLFNEEIESATSAKSLIDFVLDIIGSSGSDLTYNEIDKVTEEEFILLLSKGDQERVKELKKNFDMYDRNKDIKLSSQEIPQAIFN